MIEKKAGHEPCYQKETVLEHPPIGKKQFVLVLSEPAEGQEAQFDDYYEGLHLDEVLDSTQWKSAQRFKLVDEVGQPCPLPYLALYETTASAAGESTAIEIMNQTRDQRQQSKSINKRTAAVWVFEETGPEHLKSD